MQLSKQHRFILLAIIACGFVGTAWWLSLEYVRFETVKVWTLQIQDFARTHLWITALALVVIQTVGMFFTLPTKAIFNMVAGALLGLFGGAAVTMVGTLVGTSGLFFVSKRVFNSAPQRSFPEKLKRFEDKLQRRPLLTVASLRLILALPYGVITIFSAFTKLRYRPFIFGSFLGDIPVVLLYSAAGLKLAVLASANEALSLESIIILSIAGIGLFAGALWPSKTTN